MTLLLTAQFLHLQKNLPLFFWVLAFKSNKVSPLPQILGTNLEFRIWEDEDEVVEDLDP